MIRRFYQNNKEVIVFLVLMVLFRSSIADINRVPTGSMKPTIVEGDRIVVNKLAYDIQLPLTNTKLYQLGNPARGDIVVFESAVLDDRLVKRVIGLPGDVVAMQNNRLTINGAPSTYELINEAVSDKHMDLVERLGDFSHPVRVDRFWSPNASFNSIRVPEGHYLVLGDNRDNSADSRAIGFIPRQEIIGRSRSVFMSLDPEDYYLPRTERFFVPL